MLSDHDEFNLGFETEDEHSHTKKRKHDNEHQNSFVRNAFNDPKDVYFGDSNEKYMVKHIPEVEPFPLMNTWSPVQTVANTSKHRRYTKRKIVDKLNTSHKHRNKGGKRKTGGRRKTYGKRKTRRTK